MVVIAWIDDPSCVVRRAQRAGAALAHEHAAPVGTRGPDPRGARWPGRYSSRPDQARQSMSQLGLGSTSPLACHRLATRASCRPTIQMPPCQDYLVVGHEHRGFNRAGEWFDGRSLSARAAGKCPGLAPKGSAASRDRPTPLGSLVTAARLNVTLVTFQQGDLCHFALAPETRIVPGIGPASTAIADRSCDLRRRATATRSSVPRR